MLEGWVGYIEGHEDVIDINPLTFQQSLVFIWFH